MNLSQGVVIRPKPKVTVEFGREGAQARMENWPHKMVLTVAHVLANGSVVLILEPEHSLAPPKAQAQ